MYGCRTIHGRRPAWRMEEGDSFFGSRVFVSLNICNRNSGNSFYPGFWLARDGCAACRDLFTNKLVRIYPATGFSMVSMMTRHAVKLWHLVPVVLSSFSCQWSKQTCDDAPASTAHTRSNSMTFKDCHQQMHD